MIQQQKRLRYYYWFTLEFVKKHARKISLSFFLSFFVILSVISFSSYLDAFFFSKRIIVGMIGSYDVSNLPPSVLEKISYGLVYVDEKGVIKPALAERWEMDKTGREFTFHLKPNLTWDDNRPFTTRDLSYSFKDVVVTTVDDRTVKFQLKKPLAIFPTYLTRPIIRYPLHGVIGQYRLDNLKYKQGTLSELTLLPHSNSLSPITYKFYDNDVKLMTGFKSGEIYEMTLQKKSNADQFKGWKNLTITPTVDYNVIMTLFINTKNPILADKGMRQAIGTAISREQFKDVGMPAVGPISEASWAYNPNLKRPVYDPDSARKNIKKFMEASPSASLNFVTFYDYQRAAGRIQRDLTAAGLHTDITYSDQRLPDNFDLLLSFWQIPPDPDQYFFWHSTQTTGANITNYKNVKVDKLLEDGRSTLNIPARQEYYQQFQKVLIDEEPAIFIFHPYTYTIRRK